MEQQAVTKQINQMVAFIKQEANEKAHEILIKAEEEFNIEKLRLVEQEKIKVRTEFERKHKQIEIQTRIAFSNEVNAARLKVLQARDDVLNEVKKVVMQQLQTRGGDPNNAATKELLAKLILQDAAAQYKQNTGKDVNVSLDSANFLPAKDDPHDPCAGGVKLYTPDGKIAVDNTLNARLQVVLAQKLPDIKIMLFGRSTQRKHIDSDI